MKAEFSYEKNNSLVTRSEPSKIGTAVMKLCKNRLAQDLYGGFIFLTKIFPLSIHFP